MPKMWVELIDENDKVTTFGSLTLFTQKNV